MGRPADIQPRWLVSLMCQWARRTAMDMDGGLGYPAKSAFLTIGVQHMSRTDPTEFCARDYRELESALEKLLTLHPGRWAAMMMYYRPWTVPALQQEGWPFGDKTYYNRLHAGHSAVAGYIDDVTIARDEKLQYSEQIQVV